MFGIDFEAVDGREDAEPVVCEAHVIAVGGRASGDDAASVHFAHELGVEGFNEVCFFGHAPNPPVGFNSHSVKVSAGKFCPARASIQRKRAGMSIKGKVTSDK